MALQPDITATTPRASLPTVLSRPFLAVLVELLAVVGLFHLYGIEEGRGLLTLTPVLLGGFVLHAALPRTLRLPAFVAVSLVGYALIFPLTAWAALVAIGLGLIGLCHLPIAWSLRFTLLIAAGVVLTGMRSHWIDAAWAAPVLPIMGSIFMFRLVLYVHDLRTARRAPGLWERLAYFFLLPNALFPLFPIIDAAAFRRSWYQRDAVTIYAKGVRWMARGLVHLLLYRLIYMNLTPPLDSVHDLGGVVLSMVSSYALYLRVSGLFHLIVGMLGLFGFDLPETHHHYFLASGFNDLWRRINIYWKDFMMKIVYYPIFVRLRRGHPGRALVVSTVAVFMISWWLHSYQMFWIRGRFPLTVVDAIFWTLFAVAVLVNSELQRRHPAPKSLKARRLTPRQALVTALKTTAMFSFMCVFWSFWTGGTLEGFAELVGRADDGPGRQWLWLGVGLAGLVGAGVLHQLVLAPALARLTAAVPPGGRWASQMVFLIGLGALGSPAISGLEDDPLVASVRSEQLNEHDQGLLLRGYYEELLEGEGEGIDRGLGGLWDLDAEKPAHWLRLSETDALMASDVPLLERTLKPHLDMEFCEARLVTNAHGMRDRYYQRLPPPGTYRFAVLGASIEMGSGVENGQIFEQLTEDALNALNPGTVHARIELLNFAINGLSPIAQVPLLQTKVQHFKPDTLLFFAHTIDARILLPHVERMLATGVELPSRLRHIVDNRGVVVRDESGRRPVPPGEDASEFDDPDAEQWRYQRALLFWAYSRLVELCDTLGIRPVWVYLQHPPNQTPGMQNRGQELRQLAQEAGFHTIVLDGNRIYPPDDWQRFTLRPWDNHPNAEGHRRIADELTRKLLLNGEALGLELPPPAPASAAAGDDASPPDAGR